MLGRASAYAAWAANYRESGHHALPIMPGAKIPGVLAEGRWSPMPGWSKHCEAMPAEALHDQWEDWEGAGVGVAHGTIIGLDLDTDRADLLEIVRKAVQPSPAQRRGRKGYMGYYRPGPGMKDEAGRIRWYDGETGEIVLELLMHGTQSVLPPTIHPDTGQPYVWLTPDTLADLKAEDLPLFTSGDLHALESRLDKIGVRRSKPRKVQPEDYEAAPRGAASRAGHDLEKSAFRSVNDRALEPDALDRWWPALGMLKSRKRGFGLWEAVPVWRGSSSGRAAQDRNPNLKASPQGIVDFGANEGYTPIDLVMRARACSNVEAFRWLKDFIRPEDGAAEIQMDPSAPQAAPPAAPRPAEAAPLEPEAPEAAREALWVFAPSFGGLRRERDLAPPPVPNAAEYERLIPREAGAFPIQNPASDCPGLLGALARYLDDASAVASEAGGLAAALPMLGALMGRAYETTTTLRTNVYTVALGESGAGKTALVNPAKELLALAQLDAFIGNDRIASGSGLLGMLEAGAKISFLDEFGHMLKQISAPGAGVHANAIIREFTALYSGANVLFSGTAMATQEAKKIDCPHLCLFGMATPDQFWRAFGSASLEDGSVARYLVCPIGNSVEKNPDKSGQNDMADALKEIDRAIRGRASLGNLGRVKALPVPICDEAERARLSLIRTMSGCARHAQEAGVKGAPAILKRVAENAFKIALISAVGRDPASPQINAHDFDIGHALARWSATVMIGNIASHIADNQYEADVNIVERKVEAAGERGILRGRLKDQLRSIRKRDFMEILEALEDGGRIALRPVIGGKKPGVLVVHTKFAAD